MTEPVVITEGLTKYFSSRRGTVKAVDGIDLTVESGQVFGFLGPNGAGKTTTLRILTTLMAPDSGTARVAGLDVATQAAEVRRRIGYVGQSGGSDRAATGRENLVLQGRLYDMSAAQAKQRAVELIHVLDLGEFADRIVNTYSGGQRRRLDVALGIMNQPVVLFLDEPTIGLDPQNRANLWVQIGKLRASGATIFITTHYLEEADALSDHLAIMDHGKIVARGTPEELKRQVGCDTITVGLHDQEDLVRSQVIPELESREYVSHVAEEDGRLRIEVKDGGAAMPDLLRLFDQKGVSPQTITLSVPSLDDVFLAKTGYSLRDLAAEEGTR